MELVICSQLSRLQPSVELVTSYGVSPNWRKRPTISLCLAAASKQVYCIVIRLIGVDYLIDQS